MSPLSRLFQRFGHVLVIDTETTGLDPAKHDIIEVAAILAREDSQGQLRDVVALDSLVRLPPSRHIPRAVRTLTGITDTMLETRGMLRLQAANALNQLLCSGVLIVAHNVQFDISFVNSLLAEEGLKAPAGLSLLDTLTVFRDRHSYPHTLADAISAYQLPVPIDRTHRALEDARAVLRLLQALAAERDDLLSYVNVIGYHPRYGVSGRRIAGVKYTPQNLNSRGMHTS